MRNIWFISDTHFFHENILKFTDRDGKPIRGRGFHDVHHMNELIVQNWNKLVRPEDKVYHLGDVALACNDSDLSSLLGRLNGHKRLVLGNHDNIKRHALWNAFEKIDLWTGGKFKKYNFVASHIPLRPDQMRDGEFNVHGHIHQNLMGDPRYINVCVEHTDYAPVNLDEILSRIK